MILNLNCDRIRYASVALPVSEDPKSSMTNSLVRLLPFPTPFLF